MPWAGLVYSVVLTINPIKWQLLLLPLSCDTPTPVHITYFYPDVQSFYPYKYMINFDSCAMTGICQRQLEWNTTVGMDCEISGPITPTIQRICVWGLLSISNYDILLFHSSVATILRLWAKERSGWMPNARGCMMVSLYPDWGFSVLIPQL
jgi:hypothetical protein